MSWRETYNFWILNKLYSSLDYFGKFAYCSHLLLKKIAGKINHAPIFCRFKSRCSGFNAFVVQKNPCAAYACYGNLILRRHSYPSTFLATLLSYEMGYTRRGEKFEHFQGWPREFAPIWIRPFCRKKIIELPPRPTSKPLILTATIKLRMVSRPTNRGFGLGAPAAQK